MLSTKVIGTFFAVLALACFAPAQQPPQKHDEADIIRIKTDLVQVRAVVTDKKGQLVDGLKQEDFEILENGKPQAISFFSLERVTSSTTASPVAGPLATTRKDQTQEPAPVRKPSRTIILFADTLHLSPVSLVRAKQQLKQFVDQQLTNQDLAAVVTTSNSLGVLQQFMRDRRMLKLAVDKISLFGRPNSYFTPYLAARVLNEDAEARALATKIVAKEEYGGFAPPAGVVRGRANQILSEEIVLRRATLQTLKAVSEQLANMPGQRIIAFVSDGFTLLDQGGAEHDAFVAATSRAARSGVYIYSFSPQGLTVSPEFTAASPFGGFAFSSYMAQGLMDQQDTLRNLAADTGGQAYLNSNDVVGQFKKMLDTNSLYYAFAYYPQDTTTRKFRNISVKVKNHADYKVRSQKGYLPAKEAAEEVATTPQQRLFKAMIAPLPLTNLNVTSVASFLERDDDDAQVTLQIHLDGRFLQYPLENQKYQFNCEAAMVAFDRAGKIASSFGEVITAAFTQEQMEKGKQNGYRYNKRLKLAPGLYQIRLGVREISSDLMGTSTSWVTVPDLHNNKLTLSGLFLGKEQTEADAGNQQKSASALLIPGPPTFAAKEPIFYRFVLYNAPADTQTLLVKVEVLQSGTSVYAGNWEPLTARIVRRDNIGIELGGRMRMDIPPGTYTLRVTVRDSKNNHSTEQTIDLELGS
jgi:VWFA-related protein